MGTLVPGQSTYSDAVNILKHTLGLVSLLEGVQKYRLNIFPSNSLFDEFCSKVWGQVFTSDADVLLAGVYLPNHATLIRTTVVTQPLV